LVRWTLVPLVLHLLLLLLHLLLHLLLLLLLLLEVVARRGALPVLLLVLERGRALLLVLEPGLRRRSVPAAAHRRHRPSEKLRAPAGASSSRWGHLCGWSHAWREGRAVWTSSGGVAAVHRDGQSTSSSRKKCRKMFFLRRHQRLAHFFLRLSSFPSPSLLAPKK
jgi:hypothetical protein